MITATTEPVAAPSVEGDEQAVIASFLTGQHLDPEVAMRYGLISSVAFKWESAKVNSGKGGNP